MLYQHYLGPDGSSGMWQHAVMQDTFFMQGMSSLAASSNDQYPPMPPDPGTEKPGDASSGPKPAGSVPTNLSAPPAAGLVTQYSVQSVAFRVKWTVRGDQLLRTNNKNQISPEFVLGVGGERNAKFKIMLLPKTVVVNNSSREGFNKSKGQ